MSAPAAKHFSDPVRTIHRVYADESSKESAEFKSQKTGVDSALSDSGRLRVIRDTPWRGCVTRMLSYKGSWGGAEVLWCRRDVLAAIAVEEILMLEKVKEVMQAR